jgi:hypothetical protein
MIRVLLFGSWQSCSMNVFRLILVLVVTAGLLLCPYTCMTGGCGELLSGVESSGCHCKSCQRQKASQPNLPEDSERFPNDGHSCLCVCDGAVSATANDDGIFPVVELAFAFVLFDECDSASVVRSAEWTAHHPPRSYLKDGRAARILFQSFLI